MVQTWGNAVRSRLWQDFNVEYEAKEVMNIVNLQNIKIVGFKCFKWGTMQYGKIVG